MKIAFADMHINRRGSSTALYDLAHYNEQLLGNQSIILAPRHPATDADAMRKFKERFEVFEHDNENVEQADEIIKAQGVDALFLMKGCITDFKSNIVPNLVHMLFINDPSHYHGDQFAFISDWLADLCKQRYGLVKNSVPWMIDIKDTDSNLRAELGIPKDAFVMGYHGGADCFGIPWVNEPIKQALDNRPDLYIVLMNIDQSWTTLASHPKLIFLPGNADMEYKSRFIKTCDAMLHARHHGETFGLSCGEFSRLNRPIVGCSTVEDRCHIELLGDKFIGYRNAQELYSILMNFNHEMVAAQNWDCYSEKHSPEAVMKKFKEVFLDPLEK